MREIREAKISGNNELDLLLALKREGEITPAQLERLDLLLDQRGQAIERHLEVIKLYDQRAA